MDVSQIEYQAFFEEIKEAIGRSQYEALKQVNKELINLYWSIGKMIVDRQDKYGWGKSVVKSLSLDLQKEYPGVQGYSVQNLWYMRQFYTEYKESEKLQPLVGEISWTKHLLIMSKCKDDLEREFYIKMTRKYGWTKVILAHQIEGGSYEMFLSNQTNFDKALEEKYKYQASLAVKDEYSFDFLEMSSEYRERDLELGLVKDIRKFLIELGPDYSFISNQFKLTVGNDDFFIDLLLYHRGLQSLVAIELKTTKFKPEYAGQLQFYLTALNEQEKKAHENPAVGILICKDKDRTVVEYSLKMMNHPMGISSYRTERKVPEEMKSQLPSPEEITERIKHFLDEEE